MFNSNKNTLKFLINKERKLIIAGLVIGLFCFALYNTFVHVPLYSTQCKIYVKNIAKSDLVTSFEGGGSLVSESGHSNPLFNLYEILKSENLSNKIYAVIKEKYPQDLTALRVDSEKIFFDSYVKLISANTQPSTDIIILKLDWPNKTHAPLVLNEILKKFKEENLVIKKTGETQKREYIDQQTLEISNKLEDVRSRIKNYKEAERIANVEVETTNIINQRMELEKALYLLDSNIKYNKRKLEEYSAELNIDDATIALLATSIGTDPYLIKLNQDLAEANQKYASLKARFKDKYTETIAVKNEITKLENLIHEREKEISANLTIPKAIYDHTSSEIATNLALTQAEMVSLTTQKQALQKNINNLKRKENNLPLIQLNLDSLTKLETALADAYQSIKEKQLEAKIKENEIIDNIIILNNPSSPQSSKMLLVTNLLGFVFLGSIGGMGVAYLKHSVEDKWMDVEEIKATTGKHVFHSIPWLKSPDGETEQNIMNAAYTNIAFELIPKAKLSGASIISFLSTWKYDAKSEIADFLATKISKMGKKVLLIDLASKDSVGVDDAVKNLNTLKTQYDFIFVNAPHGFVLLPEIQPVKEMSEGIVVISSIETGRQELMRFLQNIGDSQDKILGIIVREEGSELERTFRILEQKTRIDSEEQVAYNV